MRLLRCLQQQVKKNRSRLMDPTLRAIPVMLRCLKLCLSAEEPPGSGAVAPSASSTAAASGTASLSASESILQIMERLLVEAAGDGSLIDDYARFATSGVTMEDISDLLKHAVRLKAGTDLHTRLMRVLPFLTYACPDKMTIVVRHFDDVLNFENVERRATVAAAAASASSTPSPALPPPVPGGAAVLAPASAARVEVVLEEALAKKSQAFVALCEGVERNQLGNTMKEHMMELGIVDKCVKYIAVS